jgi:hypothetical protein
MNIGFVLLWREMLEKELFREKPFCPLGAWVWIILNTNFEDKIDRFGEVVKRGELHTSQCALASSWGWTRSRVQRFLDRLETEQRIEQQTNKRRTKIRTTNYELYQQASSVFEQQANKHPNNKPNKRSGTTETSTNKQTKKQEYLARAIGELEASEDEVCSTREFTREQFRAQLPTMIDYLRNTTNKYSDLAAFARNWLRRDWNKPSKPQTKETNLEKARRALYGDPRGRVATDGIFGGGVLDVSGDGGASLNLDGNAGSLFAGTTFTGSQTLPAPLGIGVRANTAPTGASDKGFNSETGARGETGPSSAGNDPRRTNQPRGRA